MPTPPPPHQTPLTAPHALLALATLLLLVALAACANAAHHASTPARHTTTAARPRHVSVNSRLPAGVLVRVGSRVITTRTLEHWVGVQAILEYPTRPARPVPAGVIPRPPSYHACTTYLAALADASHTPPAPTAQLKQQCQTTYKTLRGQVLESLIAADWIKEEARTHHITITPQETSRALHQHFPTHTALTRYLKLTGLHTTDETTILTNQLRLQKLQHTLPIYSRLAHSKTPETGGMAGEIDAALAHLTATITQTWTPQTHCQPQNLTPLCASD